MNLKKYLEHKDSCIPWLREIPKSWELHRAKWYIKLKKEINTDGACINVLSLTLRGVVDNDPNNPEGLVPSDYKSYQIFEKNNLVFKLIDLENYKTSRVGIVHRRGIMSPAYIRVIIDSKSLSPLFYYYFYYNLYLRGVYNKIGTGVRSTLTAKNLLDLPILIPEKQEQNKIVLFLDVKLKKIANFIKKKRKLIELLNEQKQTIINHAVTRGINPNVKMKPSGIDWVGDIPERWKIKKLRHLLKPISIRNRPDLPLLSVVREKGVIVRNIDDPEENHNFIPDDLTNYKVVCVGQFAMNKMKAWQGSYGISKHDGIVSPAYFIFNMADQLFKDFFHYAIRSRFYIPFFKRASDGVRIGQWDLSISRMKEIPFLMPRYDEQKDIVRYIEKETKLINSSISHLERENELIGEYRTRLISDVVTGKVDVRDIKVEDVTDEDLADDLSSSEEIEELEDSVEEVPNEH